MKQCGVTNATDGSEDNLIEFVKQNPEAANMLRQRLNDQSAMEVDTDDESDLSDCAVIYEESDGIEYCDSDESN